MLNSPTERNARQLDPGPQSPGQLARDVRHKHYRLGLLSGGVDLDGNDVSSEEVATLKAKLHTRPRRRRDAAQPSQPLPTGTADIAVGIARERGDYAETLDERDDPRRPYRSPEGCEPRMSTGCPNGRLIRVTATSASFAAGRRLLPARAGQFTPTTPPNDPTSPPNDSISPNPWQNVANRLRRRIARGLLFGYISRRQVGRRARIGPPGMGSGVNQRSRPGRLVVGVR